MEDNTLYYSRYCQHCKNFILQLKNNDLLDYFTKKINIDNHKNNLPPFLKEVPTIITDDYNEPLSSDMAFKWVTFKIKTQNVKKEDNNKKEMISNEIESVDPTGGIFSPLTYNNDELAPQNAKRENSSIDYNSFNLIDPSKVPNRGSNNKGEEAFDQDVEKLKRMREMDNNFYGGNGTIRQG